MVLNNSTERNFETRSFPVRRGIDNSIINGTDRHNIHSREGLEVNSLQHAAVGSVSDIVPVLINSTERNYETRSVPVRRGIDNSIKNGTDRHNIHLREGLEVYSLQHAAVRSVSGIVPVLISC